MCLECFFIQSGFELFVNDPFMGSVHVDQNETSPVLREYVDVMQLGECEAKWKVFFFFFSHPEKVGQFCRRHR